VADVAGQQIQQGGAALSDIGAAVTDIAMQRHEEHALATSKAALNQWAEFADRSDQDYRAKKGEAAIQLDGQDVKPGEAPKSVVDRIEAKMRDIEDGLSQESAKRIFRQAAERGMVTYKGRLYDHETKQLKVYNHGQDVASMGRYANSYVANGDQADYKAAIAHANEIATDSGYSPEEREAFVLKLKTGMNAGVVSQFLNDGDAKGADEYLRGLDKDEIDPLERSNQRQKIDGVMKSEKADKLAVDIFINQGYRTHADRVRATASKLPKATQEQIAQSAVMDIGREMGIPQESLEAPGAWKKLLSSPEVMARLDDRILTLDQEIMKARYPGQTSATDPNTGSYSRGLKTLMDLYQAGEIDVSTLQQAQHALDDQVNRRTRERNVEAQETLVGVEQILQSGTAGTSIDSPQFRTQHPDLYESIVNQGLLSQARGLTKGVYERVTDPAYYDKLQQAHATGALARLSYKELFNTYYTHFDKTAWNEARRLWSSGQADPKAVKVGIKDDPIVKWDVAVRRHLGAQDLLTDVDAKGVPTPDDKKEQRYWLDTQRDLGKAIEDSGREWTVDEVLKWVDERELDKITVKTEGTLWDTREEMTVAALDAEEREARASGDESKIAAVLKRRKNVYRDIDGKSVKVLDNKVVVGPDNDRIPDLAIKYMRNQYRLDRLRETLPGSLFNPVWKALDSLGVNDPTKDPDGVKVEAVFEQAGLRDAWAPLEQQWRRWQKIRTKAPWRDMAPLETRDQWVSGHPPPFNWQQYIYEQEQARRR
jgi:hypothetical protein